MKFTCEVCARPFRRYPADVRKAARRGQQIRFCSRQCQHLAYRGAGNPKWRGGKVKQVSGYVYVHVPDHPYATEAGYVMEHRLVTEDRLGRVLTPEEQVHHINGVKSDNRPDNLQLVESAAAHRVLHAEYLPIPCARCGKALVRSKAWRRKWTRAYCSRTCVALANLDL